MPEPKHSKTASQAKAHPIIVTLQPDLETSQAEGLFAYVVDKNGNVVETTAFKGRSAHLTASNEALKGSRLFIGAGFPVEYPSHKINVYALAQAGAYQVSASADKDHKILIQRLPSQAVVFPRIHLCQVQGNITNNLIINGLPNSGPVCKAKVHICTVEWFFRWPIWLRPVVPPDLLNKLKESLVALRTRPVPPLPDPAPGLASKFATRMAPLDSAIENKIMAATTENIHEIVFNHAEILYPYFCLWPIFWPWFYRVVEQEVVYTDCNGYFDGWLISIGAPVTENVYVWVEASIGGTWVTVYKPPFPCHTQWNYQCGTDINITLGNPAIPPCNCDADVIDGTVWFTAIGTAGIALNIQQDETSHSQGIANVGCTNLFDSNGNQLCPFGGDLGLYLAFGPNPPATAVATATHYRWKWSYILDSSLNPIAGSPSVVTGAVQRNYLWPAANNSWETGSITLLDTDSNGNIAYQIPNYAVTSYPGVSAEAEWQSFNFLSATFPTAQVANGSVIRLDLELLYKKNGLFEPLSVSVISPNFTFQVSKDTNAGNAYDRSVPAPNDYLTLDPAKSGNALSLSLKVRVDNSPVTAQIIDAALLDDDGNLVPGGSSGPCGFIQFTDPAQEVLLSFTATEPFNFATFSYTAYRGNTGAILGASGYVFNSAAPFTLAGGVFSDEPTVTDLLGGCSQAAFAETLSVSSLATNGSIPLSQTGYPYYLDKTNAFALTPQSP